jgi:hypothetical protein
VYKSLATTVLLATGVLALGQKLPEPTLISAGLPKCPVIARLAKVQGEVKVDFTLNSNGEVVSATAISGPPLLKAAGEDNVKTWKFELPKNLYRTDWKYSSVFNFKISKISSNHTKTQSSQSLSILTATSRS